MWTFNDEGFLIIIPFHQGELFYNQVYFLYYNV